MSCSLEYKTGQLQGNGLKILMCYIPLIQRLLIYHVTVGGKATAECYFLGSQSATMLRNPSC